MPGISRLVRLALAVTVIGSIEGLATGCATPENLGSAVAPKPPTLEKKTTCSPKAEPRPLIVEQDSAERARIESLTRQGLVAVRYQGCSLEVLPACHATAGYRWAAVSLKRERVVMRNSDELQAELPIGGAKLAGELASRGELTADMTVAGRWESTQPTTREDELDGECDGATHVVRALNVGAFKLFSSATGRVKGGVSVLGAGAAGSSSSEHSVLNEDGDAARCSESSDKGPTKECGSVVRLELAPLKEGILCPTGGRWDGTRCQWETKCGLGLEAVYAACVPNGVHYSVSTTCLTGENATCEKECAAGNAESCGELGFRLLKEDARRAVAFSRRACDGGSTRGCSNLAAGYLGGHGGLPRDVGLGLDLFRKACDAEFPIACVQLAIHLWNGTGMVKDRKRARELFRRACDQGNVSSCFDLSSTLPEEEHAAARDYAEKACDGGHPDGCARAGFLHLFGKNLPKDSARALPYLRKACNAGSPQGCALLGGRYIEGEAVPTDLPRAFGLLRRACNGGRSNACGLAGQLLVNGNGVPQDIARGRALLTKGCDGGDPWSCKEVSRPPPPRKEETVGPSKEP